MPYDIALAEAMRQALQRRRSVVEKKMFGGYCWMLKGNMLCGVEVGRYMFRVGKALEAEALSRPGARPMDITGKPMAGFVWVDASQANATGLDTWIELAAKYVGSLPAK
jgi:TfoX/Sxy family transcriptional regulator of competence genes